MENCRFSIQRSAGLYPHQSQLNVLTVLMYIGAKTLYERIKQINEKKKILRKITKEARILALTKVFFF